MKKNYPVQKKNTEESYPDHLRPPVPLLQLPPCLIQPPPNNFSQILLLNFADTLLLPPYPTRKSRSKLPRSSEAIERRLGNSFKNANSTSNQEPSLMIKKLFSPFPTLIILGRSLKNSEFPLITPLPSTRTINLLALTPSYRGMTSNKSSLNNSRMKCPNRTLNPRFTMDS